MIIQQHEILVVLDTKIMIYNNEATTNEYSAMNKKGTKLCEDQD